MEQNDKALAPRGGDHIIRSPADFTARLQRWHHEHFHVLSPIANFSALPEHFGLVPTLVKLDPDPSPKGSGDVYQDNAFTRGDDVAIAKIGLSKIAQAAGMSITTVRTDDRRIPNLWEVRATAKWIGIDGTPQQVDATEEYDLRDGSPRLRGFTEKQTQAARAKGLRGCEARAINAAIRQFGVKQKYTKAELEKPFVIVRVVYTPDLSDPTTRQAVNERRLAGTSTLYGSTAPAALPAATPEVLDTIGGTPDPRVIDHPPPSTTRAAAPPPRPVWRVESVQHDLEGGLYDITFVGGRTATTRATEVATALLDAKKRGAGVQAVIDEHSGELKDFVIHADGPPEESTDPALRKIVAIKIAREGTNNNGAWKLYEIVAEGGESWRTFSSTHASLAEEAKAKGWPVRIVEKENEKYPDQKDLESITLVDPRQPTLPGTTPAGGY